MRRDGSGMVGRGHIMQGLVVCGGDFGLTSTKAVLRAWVLGHEEENQFQESSRSLSGNSFSLPLCVEPLCTHRVAL